MKLLVRLDHPVLAHHVANVLRAAGIRCEVRNTALAGAIGEIPFLEALAQVWVENDLEVSRARLILDELHEPVAGGAWTCACGERIEPQFGECWSCGRTREVGAG